jgi:hypothetical protein
MGEESKSEPMNRCQEFGIVFLPQEDPSLTPEEKNFATIKETGETILLNINLIKNEYLHEKAKKKQLAKKSEEKKSETHSSSKEEQEKKSDKFSGLIGDSYKIPERSLLTFFSSEFSNYETLSADEFANKVLKKINKVRDHHSQSFFSNWEEYKKSRAQTAKEKRILTFTELEQHHMVAINYYEQLLQYSKIPAEKRKYPEKDIQAAISILSTIIETISLKLGTVADLLIIENTRFALQKSINSNDLDDPLTEIDKLVSYLQILDLYLSEDHDQKPACYLSTTEKNNVEVLRDNINTLLIKTIDFHLSANNQEPLEIATLEHYKIILDDRLQVLQKKQKSYFSTLDLKIIEALVKKINQKINLLSMQQNDEFDDSKIQVQVM